MPSPKVPSAKVLANRAKKVVMNRAALDAMQIGMADVLLATGQRIIADASKGPGGSGVGSLRDPEAAAKRGVPMMLDTGHVGVWGLGKKIGGDMTAKPRGLKTPKDQVVMVAAFASPLAHFAELGTIKEIARPFLTPAFNRGIPGAADAVPAAMAKRVRAVR